MMKDRISVDYEVRAECGDLIIGESQHCDGITAAIKALRNAADELAALRDEEISRRTRKLSRLERLEAMADAGFDTWDDCHGVK